METNRLRQFCVVAETQNLRKAADILGISHGGLFKSIRVLEEDLGFELFRKEGRGIVITERGKQFLPRVHKFLEAQNELLQEQDNKRSAIRIGTFEVFSTYFFSRALVKNFEGEEILLRELTPGGLEKALLDNEIDIGVTYEPIPMQGLQILMVSKCSMAVFGRKEIFGRLDLSEIPFAAPVIPFNSIISGVKGLDGWPDDKVPRNIQYKVDMMETALQLCSEGMAVGFFPEFVVSLYNKTRISDFKLELISCEAKVSTKRAIYIVLRTSSEESALVKKIARCIRTTCF